MTLLVNTNVFALNALYTLGGHTNNIDKALERLSSGSRINRSSDDVLDNSQSGVLKAQLRSLEQAQKNTQDGISLLAVVDGSLGVIGEHVQRIRELTVQLANDSYALRERQAMAQEMALLAQDIDRVASAANFNGLALLDGTSTSLGELQVGIGSASIVNTVDVGPALADSRTNALGIIGGPNAGAFITSINDISNPLTGTTQLTDNGQATLFLQDLDLALNTLYNRRATVGALSNQLQDVNQSLSEANINVSAFHSVLRDADIAAEMSVLTQSRILEEASSMILNQANQQRNAVQQLLLN
ncbi:MAG: flagellin [Candidatus Melainabacteria bacterium]|nr:flagellin [Candidatus Melainabacteria bacterium]